MNDDRPDLQPEGNDPRSSAADRPSHPPLAAALLMLGIVVFLVIVSVLAAR